MDLQETESESTPTNVPDFGNGGDVLAPEPEKKKDTSVKWGGCVERVDLLVEIDSGVRICIPFDYHPLPTKGHVSGRRLRKELKGVYDGRDYPVDRQVTLFSFSD